MKRLFLSLTITLFISSLALAGGGWTKQKGTGYYKVSHWWVNAAKQYTFNGNTAASIKEGIFNTSIFAEYGVTDRFTAIVNLPYSKSANANESVAGIGDTDLALKYRISKAGSKFVLAGTLLLGLPLGEEAGGSDGSLQTGDGEFNQMMRLDLSKSFQVGSVNAYANIYTAYNNRTENFSDEMRIGAEVGGGFLNNKIWAILRLDVVESFGNGAESTALSDGATIFSNNTEYVAYTTEIAGYITDKIGVSAATASVLSASNIFAAPSYSLGVFYDMK
ncbi:hypothetical protein [Ekhidna sp. To15]|uniref:hypothetical protein n=1 Tax=Ekhidna sp. To15 TaxID=3395267 RepID=UPI003F525387